MAKRLVLGKKVRQVRCYVKIYEDRAHVGQFTVYAPAEEVKRAIKAALMELTA